MILFNSSIGAPNGAVVETVSALKEILLTVLQPSTIKSINLSIYIKFWKAEKLHVLQY